VLVAGAAWILFLGTDTLGLPTRTDVAHATAREHIPAGRTYPTEIVGGRSVGRPCAVPETYLLRLQVGKPRGAAAVERPLYDALRAGEQVTVEYRRRRLTGAADVLRVLP